MKKIPPKETNERSAIGTNFGIAFQNAAALFIALKHMNSVIAIGMEDMEDIRIELKGGRKFYAQAKSACVPDKIHKNSHMSTSIKDSMQSLYKNKDNGAEKLITIFNFKNPFGSQPKYEGYSNKIFLYDDLMKKTKKTLLNYVKDDYEVAKRLEFWFLRFEGEENPYSDLESFVSEYIKKISASISSNKLTKSWLTIIERNGIDKKRLIDFGIIIGSIFSEALASVDFEKNLTILGINDLDFYEVEELNKVYREYISQPLPFQHYSSFLKKYMSFKEAKNLHFVDDEHLQQFIETQVETIENHYLNLFDLHKNKEYLARVFKKIIIVTYIQKHNIIQKIKEVFDYEN